MDQGPLVAEQLDAASRFLSEFQKYMPVSVAFWLKDDQGEWNLYVASDQITDDNFDVVYGEVARIGFPMRDPWFDPFQVKVIGLHDPLAQAALKMQSRYPGRMATHLHGKTFDGLPVEEMYIYPSAVPSP